jgi:hypothetical protein
MYLGISPTKFDELVKDGRMPRPRNIDNRKVWDVYELDMAFDELPREDSPPMPRSRNMRRYGKSVPASDWLLICCCTPDIA